MAYPMESLTETAIFLVDKLKANQGSLGLIDIFYGDQNRIPRTPAACVEPGTKSSTLEGAPRRVMINITTYIIVYHNPVKSTEAIRAEDDALAEDIETLIHADPDFKDVDGNSQVIQSLVTSIESGYQQKAGSLFRASRLSVESQVKVTLPSAV